MRSAQLESLKTQLLEMRARLSRQIDGMLETIPEKASGTGDLSHVPTHNADRDSEGVDKEIALVESEQGMLEEVIEAVKRIDDGTFGACTRCGEEIAEDRLEAIPYTPYCINCARTAVGRTRMAT